MFSTLFLRQLREAKIEVVGSGLFNAACAQVL
jgi:hypothetical protein